eukprot:gnl/MRDRNA2_/MRDRNA2_72862_c0_seq1.p1 gnl/MRDRNA2_/MRDRNA2_72862_c0~~gnl/MRDRNA2_/MRDRNA2_72862_c0_seq1.p1  ORF type:complete len:116 (+),score=19.11 gnl/MRDRNA2_/MRDRNA2_72862_c0_seq1:116-463(+)
MALLQCVILLFHMNDVLGLPSPHQAASAAESGAALDWTSAIARTNGKDISSPPSYIQTGEAPTSHQAPQPVRLAVGGLVVLVLIYVATRLAKSLALRQKSAEEMPLTAQTIQVTS